MSDYLQPQDLIDDKKHSTFFAEVITGKAGGVAGGTTIDTATNAVTSQVQKTMPKIMGDAESAFNAQIAAHEIEHDNQIAAHEIEHDNQIAAHEIEHDNQISAHEAEFIAQLQAQGWNPVSGSFEAGGTIVNRRDILWWEAAKAWYSWQGALPKTVTAGSTPATAGGVSPTAWVDRTDGALRTELASDVGANLVSHKSAIADAVSLSIADYLDLQPITPEMFGADGTVAGDTAALVKAFAAAYLNPCRIELSRIYKLNQPLTCYYVQTHNKAIEIVPKHRDAGIEWHGPTDSYVIDIHGKSASIGAIMLVEASGSNNSSTGLRVCGYSPNVSGVRCTGSWKRGVLGVACLFGAEFNGIYCDLDQSNDISAKTGVPLQLVSCINASVSKGFATNATYPYVFGVLSGESAELLKPPSLTETITWGNEGVTANQYKSTVTTNGPVMRGLEIESTQHVFDLIYNNFMTLEGMYLKLSDGWLGAHPSTPASAVVFGTIGTGPAYVKLTGNTMSMGAATSAVTHTTIADVFDYPYSEFSQNIIEKWACTVSGTNRIRCVTNEVTIGGTDVALVNSNANNVFIPDARKSRLSEGLILGKDTPDGDGKLQIRANSGERLFNGLTAAGVILSTCPGGLGVSTVTPASTSVLYVGSISSTGRSINATGTINASGADYAEYMRKAKGCGVVEKGQVIGINNSGEITDVFDDAVAFSVKSTDPSLVGGNLPEWDIGYPTMPDISEPVRPDVILRQYGQSDEEYAAITAEVEARYESELIAYQAAISAHNAAMIKWQADYDAAREQYDRIAFCGRVPCNVEAAPGDYIIPTRGNDGGITAIAVSEPSLSQYLKSVGQCWSGTVGGKALVAVKIA